MDLMAGRLSDRMDGDERLDSEVAVESVMLQGWLAKPDGYRSILDRIGSRVALKKRCLFAMHLGTGNDQC